MSKRYHWISMLMLTAAAAAFAVPSQAALRVPQILFGSTQLQGRLDGLGESISVLTQQEAALVWGSTVSSNATMTILYELSGNPTGDELGIAKLNAAGNVVTGLAMVFPAAADSGWFAVASFRPGDNLIVTLFNQNATLIGQTAYTGVNRNLFAYYIGHIHGTFYSHEGFNSDGKVHALAYAATGINAGSWWLAWEDTPIAEYTTKNFMDALMFLESVNPTPVTRSSWGAVKERFR
jgi:hypothetical protein